MTVLIVSFRIHADARIFLSDKRVVLYFERLTKMFSKIEGIKMPMSEVMPESRSVKRSNPNHETQVVMDRGMKRFYDLFICSVELCYQIVASNAHLAHNKLIYSKSLRLTPTISDSRHSTCEVGRRLRRGTLSGHICLSK